MHTPPARCARLLIAVGLLVTAVAASHAGAAEARVDLGTAESFAVLAATTVTNTGASIVGGDLGVSPGNAVVGFPPGRVNNGVIHAGDAVAAQAQRDLTAAYNDAAGRPPSATGLSELGNQRLVAGVYSGSTLSLTGTLTLDAQGDPNAVFIFQAAETLTTATASRVEIVNGAQACNVFWQIGSSATLGTDSVFVGTILALASVTATTRATVQGRLLARTGAVTLDSNTITPAGCSPPATTSTTSTTAVDATTTTTSAATGGSNDVPSSSEAQPGALASPAATADTAASGPAGTGSRGGRAETARSTTRGGSADSSSRTARSTPRLAATGSTVSATMTVGLLVLVLGVVMLLVARRLPEGRRTA